MTKKVAFYALLSTPDQNTDNQLIELRRYVQAREWETEEFIDQAIGGGKGGDDRAQLKAMLAAADQKKFDAIVIWRFDRFARSMHQLVKAVNSLATLRISFISLREKIDTTTANGRQVLRVFTSLAQFEGELKHERIQLALMRAKAEGKRIGRPQLPVNREEVLMLKANGFSTRSIAFRLGICKDTVRNILKRVSGNPSQVSFLSRGKTERMPTGEKSSV